MNKKERQQAIYNLLSSFSQPVSGSELARRFSVSRQVIVSDIAELKKRDSRIQSTISGYRIEQPLYQMEVSVCHSDEQMADELYELVDHGIAVLSVWIEHPIYGRLEAALNLFCRRDVDHFLESLVHENTRPLTLLTHGKHKHLLQANSEEILAQAPEILEKQGILESVTASSCKEKTS